MSELNFSMMIEKHVLETGQSYMDAVIDICDKNEIEIDSLRSAINNTIKEKIEIEAKSLRMMKDNEETASLFD